MATETLTAEFQKTIDGKFQELINQNALILRQVKDLRQALHLDKTGELKTSATGKQDDLEGQLSESYDRLSKQIESEHKLEVEKLETQKLKAQQRLKEQAEADSLSYINATEIAKVTELPIEDVKTLSPLNFGELRLEIQKAEELASASLILEIRKLVVQKLETQKKG